MTDAQRFSEAIYSICGVEQQRSSIGVLGEKTLHAVLKQYYMPDPRFQEVKVGRHVADICTDEGIIEIQTRNFSSLRPKLEDLLDRYPVTVVHPIPQTKWLRWIDPDTGEISPRRRSSKHYAPADAFRELSRIGRLLDHPNLTLRFPLLELEEYRCRDGWGSGGKRGSTRYERIPLALLGEVVIHGAAEYGRLLPEGLEEPFSSASLAKAGRLSLSTAQIGLRLLYRLGVIEKTGKEGNRILYRRSMD